MFIITRSPRTAPARSGLLAAFARAGPATSPSFSRLSACRPVAGRRRNRLSAAASTHAIRLQRRSTRLCSRRPHLADPTTTTRSRKQRRRSTTTRTSRRACQSSTTRRISTSPTAHLHERRARPTQDAVPELARVEGYRWSHAQAGLDVRARRSARRRGCPDARRDGLDGRARSSPTSRLPPRT